MTFQDCSVSEILFDADRILGNFTGTILCGMACMDILKKEDSWFFYDSRVSSPVSCRFGENRKSRMRLGRHDICRRVRQQCRLQIAKSVEATTQGGGGPSDVNQTLTLEQSCLGHDACWHETIWWILKTLESEVSIPQSVRIETSNAPFHLLVFYISTTRHIHSQKNHGLN